MDNPPVDRTHRHRIVVGAIVGAIILGIGIAVWFEPQALLIDKRVDEIAPAARADGGGSATLPADAPRLLRLTGSFRSIDHATSGRAIVTADATGDLYLRLEDFETDNGPDLVVYLSTAPATADGVEYAEDFLDLGMLKGNIGNQNYAIPEGANVKRYRSVVIWCRRFNVAFGSAPLSAS